MEHVVVSPVCPESLCVTKLHLEELSRSEDTGHLVTNLEQFPPCQHLGHQTAVGPHVSRGTGRRRLEWPVIVDGRVTIVPPPVLNNPVLNLLRHILQILQPFIARLLLRDINRSADISCWFRVSLSITTQT